MPFMEPEVWVPCSQEPAIHSYPEPHASNLHPTPPQFLWINFNDIFLSAWKFIPLRFPDQNFWMHFSSIPVPLHVQFCYSRWFCYCSITWADQSRNALLRYLMSKHRGSGFESHGMEICPRLFCVGRRLATGWSPVQGVLPTVYRIKKLKKRRRPQQRALEQ
jgi:hypothetical protein